MYETRPDRPDRSALALSSYASSAGFALGELLLLTGKSDNLPEYLREIHVTAQATIISAEAGSEPVTIRRQGVTLSDAAIRAVRAWSADSQDPVDLDDAMALLSEILVEMGVLQDVLPRSDQCVR